MNLHWKPNRYGTGIEAETPAFRYAVDRRGIGRGWRMTEWIKSPQDSGSVLYELRHETEFPNDSQLEEAKDFALGIAQARANRWRL